MRLSRDSSSWRAQGLARKYKECPDSPVKATRKNTKKWCKGKVGVLHDLDLIKTDRFNWWREMLWVHWKCANCGKKFTEMHHR